MKQLERDHSLKKKFKKYFIPLTHQIELLLLSSLVFLSIILVSTQILVHIDEGNYAYLNKSIQYEGVFRQEERIEVRATLQRH